MADTSLMFDIFARDRGAARAFRDVSRELDGVGDSTGRLRRDTTRLSSATDDLSHSQTEMGLAARRAGLAAAEAADKAAAAQRRAATAAERLERGEISEEAAARAAANAARALERAEIAQATAARAAARAQDELAQQLRQAAAAQAMEDLALMRAAGNRRSHNALLRDSRHLLGDLGHDTSDMSSLMSRAWDRVERSGRSAMTKIGDLGSGLLQSWPALLVGAAVGIATLPVAAIAAGGAITLGLGGALAAVGIKAVAQSASVQAAWHEFANSASSQAATWAAPWKPAIAGILRQADGALRQLGPTMTGIFAQMAPAVERFTTQLAHGVAGMGPSLAVIGNGFNKILDQLGPQLPDILANVAFGLETIAKAAGNHAAEFAQFASALGTVINGLGVMAAGLIETGSQVQKFFGILDFLGGKPKKVADEMGSVSTASAIMADQMGGANAAMFEVAHSGAAGSGALIKTVLAMDLATQSGEQLKKTLDSLAGGTLGARAASRAFEGAIDDMAASLKKNGKTFDIHTEKGRANAAALDTIATSGLAAASAQQKVDSTGRGAARALADARGAYIHAAVAGGETRASAAKAADALGLVAIKARDIPSSKTVTVKQHGIGDAIAASKTLKSSIDALHGKQINITTTFGTVHLGDSIAASKRATGGYIGPGYAVGGMVRHMAAAGMVTGPGTGTSDSIPTMLSNGEFVVNARDTAANRGLLEDINSGRSRKKKRSPWQATSTTQWGKDVSFVQGKGRAGRAGPLVRDPSWWHGQADTAFGPGRAHFAWGSDRPEVAAAVKTAKPAKPTSPWGKASQPSSPFVRDSIAPQRFQLEWVGGRGDDALLKLLRDAIQIRGGNVQKTLGQSS